MTITPTGGCVVCGPSETQEHEVSEAMFGTGEGFVYNECLACGSLQISAVPPDLGRYYDTQTYYSFSDEPVIGERWLSSGAVRRVWRAQSLVFMKTGLGRGVPWTRVLQPRLGDRILDMGCGSGRELMRLRKFGFRNLAGSDPFAESEGEIFPGIPVFKRYHHQLEGTFDVITLSHSFEHVADPRETLLSIRRLLRKGGRAVIRIPVMGSYAWRTYGTNWVQIDAPRHLFLPTPGAFERMASDEGLRVDMVRFDSGEFQFWGSELVSRGEPHAQGPGSFSPDELKEWRRQSRRLNRLNDGDQAMFVLSVR